MQNTKRVSKKFFRSRSCYFWCALILILPTLVFAEEATVVPLSPADFPENLQDANSTKYEEASPAEKIPESNLKSDEEKVKTSSSESLSIEHPSEIVTPPANTLRSEEEILESPTQFVDEYEKIRKKKLHKDAEPGASFNFTYAPYPFLKTEFRVPSIRIRDSFLDLQSNPRFFGIFLGKEYFLIKKLGVLGVGLEGGVYATTMRESFRKHLPGFFAVTPYLQYQFNYWFKQVVVPTVKAGFEGIYYDYLFSNVRVRGMHGLVRIDMGVMLNLHALEEEAAKQMQYNYGIKRMFLAGFFTKAIDISTIQHFDLSETSLRFGLRFEH